MEFTATRKRAIKDGTEYDHLFLEAQLTEPVLKGDSDVQDTVHFMMDIVAKDNKDTLKITKKLKGKTLYETCKNIYDFTYNYIQYEKDKHGIEQLRRTARTWHDRKKGL